jgi:hypothetical protein
MHELDDSIVIARDGDEIRIVGYEAHFGEGHQ